MNKCKTLIFPLYINLSVVDTFMWFNDYFMYNSKCLCDDKSLVTGLHSSPHIQFGSKLCLISSFLFSMESIKVPCASLTFSHFMKPTVVGIFVCARTISFPTGSVFMPLLCHCSFFYGWSQVLTCLCNLIITHSYVYLKSNPHLPLPVNCSQVYDFSLLSIDHSLTSICFIVLLSSRTDFFLFCLKFFFRCFHTLDN